MIEKDLKNVICDTVAFPSIEDLTHMEEDTEYVYVPYDFCVCLSNSLLNRSAWMIARYSIEKDMDCFSASLSDNDERLKCFFENVEDIEKIPGSEWIHTKLNCFCKDDVIISGESENYYYYVWLDNDVSDCCICKISKAHYETIEDFNEAVESLFASNYKIRPIRKPNGMIKW